MLFYERNNEDVASLQNQNAGDSIGLCNCVCPVLDRYVEDSENSFCYIQYKCKRITQYPTYRLRRRS